MAKKMIVNGKEVTFKLELDVDGEVMLRASKVEGEKVFGGLLIRINTDGTFTRFTSVADEFGFKLNSGDHIKEKK